MLQQPAFLSQRRGRSRERHGRGVHRVKLARSGHIIEEFGYAVVGCFGAVRFVHAGQRLVPKGRRLTDEGSKHIVDRFIAREARAVGFLLVGAAAVLGGAQDIVHHRLDVLRAQESLDTAVLRVVKILLGGLAVDGREFLIGSLALPAADDPSREEILIRAVPAMHDNIRTADGQEPPCRRIRRVVSFVCQYPFPVALVV